MRIPIYNADVNPIAPQLGTPQVAEAIDIGPVINFVENQYEQGVREKEQAQKLFAANETSRVQLALDTKYSELADAVNQGDYAAEKKWEKFYNKTTKESTRRLSDMPAVQTAAMMDYERSGVEYGLRLKGATRNKMKSDALSNNQSRLSKLAIGISNAETDAQRQNILSEVSGIYAQGGASGLYDENAAREGVRKFFEASVDSYIKNNPAGFLEDVKENPDKYKGVGSLNKRILQARGERLKQKTQAELQSLADGVLVDDALDKKEKEGSLTFSDIEGRNDEYSKYLRGRLTQDVALQTFTPEEKRAITADFQREYDLLNESVFNEGGYFDVSAENITKVHDFVNRVRMSGGGVYSSENKKFLELQDYVRDVYVSGETDEETQGGFLGFFGKKPYERAIAKVDSILEGSNIDPNSVEGYLQKEAILNSISEDLSSRGEELSINDVDKMVGDAFSHYITLNNPGIPTGDETPQSAILNDVVVPLNSSSEVKGQATVNSVVTNEMIEQMTETELNAFLGAQ